MIVGFFTFFSCERSELREGDSDLAFSRTCDFGNSDFELVKKLSGTLQYATAFHDAVMPEPIFFVFAPGFSPLVVCNMPGDFEMEDDESRNVTFSGRVLVYPEEVDALSTDIELSAIKFE